MSIQGIFNKVIDAGLYNPNSSAGTCMFMCNALSEAYTNGVISYEEYFKVDLAIRRYLGWTNFTLRSFLEEKGGREGVEDYELLAIYQDWENRPYKE